MPKLYSLMFTPSPRQVGVAPDPTGSGQPLAMMSQPEDDVEMVWAKDAGQVESYAARKKYLKWSIAECEAVYLCDVPANLDDLMKPESDT